MKNWLSEFKKKQKKNSSHFKVDDYNEILNEFQVFLGLPASEANLIAGYCLLRSRQGGVKASDLIGFMEETESFDAVNENLEKLFVAGWFRYDVDGPFSSPNHLLLSHDAELSLKTSKTSCFPHKKVNENNQILLRIYAKAISLKNKNISTDDWESATAKWLKKPESQFIKAIQLKSLNAFTQALALYVGTVYAIEGQLFELNFLLKLFFNDKISMMQFRSQFNDVNNPLFTSNLLEKIVSPRGDVFLKPSEDWLNKFICGNSLNTVLTTLPNTLVRFPYKEIKEKSLFYNSDINEQVQNIREILHPKNYNRFVKETTKNKENGGIVLLFSGGPGTGKTELAKQLAIESKRDLLFFEVSQQRQMYLGESEKTIKEIFHTYAQIINKKQEVPILFFNEADSVFQKRMNFEGNISQTENAVQTILLNELENFNGILICTTNRPESMDKAFDRRFLMHLKITEPNCLVKAQLLKHNFPELITKEMHTLSNEFNFTAANLETFKKQKMITGILKRKTFPIADALRSFFNDLEQTTNTKNKIGFTYN